MNDHLTEDMLLKYQFDLADENEVRQVTAHLGQCDKCRAKLEAIKLKFSALDVLGGEADVPEGLIEQTVSKAKTPVSTIGSNFKKPVWIAAAAVVMVAAIAVMISSKPSHLEKRRDLALTEAQPTETGDLSLTKELTATAASQVTLIDPADIPDKAPFAPASAIELVVLPERESTQLTIYNAADLTLVREKRSLTLKAGWNWLQFMWANTLIDPTSLSLEPLAYKDKVEVELLSYPARLKDIGRWLIRSEVEGQVDFEITYLTSGVRWRAFYMGTLSEDARKMKLEGYVRVANNSGEDYADAETRLIVGKVNVIDKVADLARRRYPYGSPVPMQGIRNNEWGMANGKAVVDGEDKNFALSYGMGGFGGGGFGDGLKLKEIKKEGLSEYFLYTIEGTETIRDKWSKRLPSLDVADIEVESLYKYDEDMYGRGTVRFVSFVNDQEHEMGDTPIPDGSVKIYRSLADGHLSYEGGTSIKYIPVGEDVELNLGPVSKVTVAPVLMDLATENYRFDDDKIVGFDEVRRWKLEVKNTTEIDAEIEITRGFSTADWKMDFDEDGVNYEMHDARHARFTMTMKPRSKRVFEYTVTTYHGTRVSEIRSEQ